MAIYVFSLLVGYVPSGVDYAQGRRYEYFKKLSQPVKYVYAEMPIEITRQRYQSLGIDSCDMLSAHLFLCGNGCLGKDVNITKKTYYSGNRLTLCECYSDRLLYTDYYSGIEERENILVKRSFRREDGTVAYDMIFDSDGQQRYLFPNGENLSSEEFLGKFIRELALTEDDIVFIDRPGYMEYVQALFQYGNRAKIVTFLHSNHYAEINEASDFVYLNYEYYYWFRYSEYIHTMIVSTEAQKKDLIQRLQQYGCKVPNVVAIPINGIERLYYPEKERKACSLVTVSRIAPVKKVEWIVQSVAKAHDLFPDITLDIYGKGDLESEDALRQEIAKHHAEEYICLKGHCDSIMEVYKRYEAYISASMSETLGISLLEAISSGNAVIGLDVKYGNSLFIKEKRNGYLIDYDYSQGDNEEYVDRLTTEMAHKVIELFSRPERLKKFQEQSYLIAKDYMSDIIEERWINFMEEVIGEKKGL